jgi:putative serine protease PepD
MPPTRLDSPSLWSDEAPVRPDRGHGGSGGAGGRHDRPRRRGRNAPLAVLLVTSAVLGGGASTGILALAGAFDGGSTATTVVQPSTSPTSASTASTAAEGDGGALDAEALYAATSAGVVDITSTGTASAQSQGASPFGQDPGRQQSSTATGTGFVVDDQGHIVTASHVVDGASKITVKFEDGTTRTATLLGQDDATDVAVLKIDPSGLTLHPLTLGSSASVDVGDDLAVIGDPFGYARSISTGIVSGVDRTIEAPNGFTVAHAIQTDAAMNPGNSGGPVLNARGEVIGIADQIATNSGADQSSGVGFAVPIDVVKAELATLKSGGDVRHAYLGVSTSDSTSQTAGATVGQVASGGPAADAGLRAGDIVTKLGDRTVADSNDLVAAIAAQQPGDRVQLTVRRGSQTVQVTVTLGTQPASSGAGG